MLIEEATRIQSIHKQRSARGLDYAYYVVPGAHVYTSAHLLGKMTTRFYVSIAIAPTRVPFELSMSGKSALYEAAIIKPLAQSGKTLREGPLFTLHLEPTHRHFRRFHLIPSPGVLRVDRALFSRFDADLQDACDGRLSLDDAATLINGIVDVAAELVPEPPLPDARFVAVCESLWREPNISLSDIATELGLSYDRTSHLFTAAMGLPFRSYQLWRKVRRANRILWSGQSLTAAAHGAGFADSAHLCRIFQQVFGRPPSYFYNRRFVKIIATDPSKYEHNERDKSAAQE